MKKLLMGLLAVLTLVGIQGTVQAHTYNPYQEIYKNIAHQEQVPGRVQFVYVLKDENGASLSGAVLKYLDYDGQEHMATADDQGLVRMVFLRGNPFVQLREVVIGETVLPVIGHDIAEGAEQQDFKEGEVEYYVLQKHVDKPIMHVYDAD